jgi:hypothetical protein
MGGMRKKPTKAQQAHRKNTPNRGRLKREGEKFEKFKKKHPKKEIRDLAQPAYKKPTVKIVLGAAPHPGK